MSIKIQSALKITYIYVITTSLLSLSQDLNNSKTFLRLDEIKMKGIIIGIYIIV